jgi:hypothetical protein
MVEIEVQLAKALGWSLYDIDETDAAHLLEFINHLTGERSAPRVYADQVSWL